MHGILNSSFVLFSISTYLSRISTFCFPIRISKTDLSSVEPYVMACTTLGEQTTTR